MSAEIGDDGEEVIDLDHEEVYGRSGGRLTEADVCAAVAEVESDAVELAEPRAEFPCDGRSRRQS